MKDWLKQIIIQKACSFLIKGEEVTPTLFGVNARGRVFVMTLGELFKSETGKDRAVALGQELVRQQRLTLTALVYEAWLSSAVNLKPGMRPSRDPQRQERLILMLETSTDLEVSSIPIKNRKLHLSKRTTLENVSTRFRFFTTREPPPLAA